MKTVPPDSPTPTYSGGVASSAQIADQADQSPLVVHRPLGTRHHLDDELVIASSNGKSRTGFPAQHLIGDQNALDASEPGHRIQELPIRLN